MKLWEPKRNCPKAVPRHLLNHVVWSRTLKCGVKSYVTVSSTKCYFNEFLFIRILTHDKIEKTNSYECSECHDLRFCIRPTSKRWFLKIKPSDHETWSIWCHVGIHVDFTSILHSRILMIPQPKCEANLDQLHLFRQWEYLKSNGHRLSVLCVKWPLIHLHVALLVSCNILDGKNKIKWNHGHATNSKGRFTPWPSKLRGCRIEWPTKHYYGFEWCYVSNILVAWRILYFNEIWWFLSSQRWCQVSSPCWLGHVRIQCGNYCKDEIECPSLHELRDVNAN
jgi:hypothetical protein